MARLFSLGALCVGRGALLPPDDGPPGYALILADNGSSLLLPPHQWEPPGYVARPVHSASLYAAANSSSSQSLVHSAQHSQRTSRWRPGMPGCS